MSGEKPTIVLPKAEAGPSFRWGNTATAVTSTLSFLLLLALAAPDLTVSILSIALQLVGGLAVLAYVVLSVQFLRLSLLRILLRWSGWAYHPMSPWTRLYLGIVGVLGGSKPKLWELQSTLPSLPVPELNKTLARYLDSVKPLLTPEEFEKTKQAVDQFKGPGGVGEKLQAALIKRAETEPTSWLLEWWENLIYLKGRMPLTLFSNWYGLDRVDPLLRSQVARAANLVNGLMTFKNMLDTQSLEPNRVQGTVPLCMWQYSRIFGTVRIPGEEIDQLQTNSKSKHIVVICKDRFFRVNLYDSDGPLSATDIQTQFVRILEATKDIDLTKDDEPKVAVLTSENRTTWAKLRKELMEMDETNKKTIETIESALFVLILEEDAPNTVEELCGYGMHRKGKSLWYDKNFNLMVCSNGRFCSNVDHTWADASVLVHVFDFVFSVESSVDHWVPHDPSDTTLPSPEQLSWKITPEVRGAIDVAQAKLSAMTQAVEVNVLKFQFYGKGLIKKFNMSPDAFCQMAIQLAYYQLHKQVVLTYESAATVRFRNGRTETVRSASNESRAFVEAIEDSSKKDPERLKLLQAAVKKHTRTMRAATNGDGVDRHLLGLRILAAGSGMDPLPSIFTDKGYQFEFKISTSQTPAVGTLGGGFSPLAQDGYGVSYVVTEDRLWFHITAYAQCPTTSAVKFANQLSDSLLAMQRVCFSDPKVTAKVSKRLYRIQRVE